MSWLGLLTIGANRRLGHGIRFLQSASWFVNQDQVTPPQNARSPKEYYIRDECERPAIGW
jgi:hypothetical protein